jgi:two-component sensor histidine kinase
MDVTPSPNVYGDGAMMLVEEISHRVVNEYARTIASMTLAAAQSPDASARLTLIKAAEQLRAHAEAHRILQAPCVGELFDLGAYLQRICGAMSVAWLSGAGIRLTLVQDQVELSSDRCWRLGLIVSELITNAARHGLSGGGEIVVEISAQGDDIYCRVADNGRPKAAATAGRGQTLVKALVEDLGGGADWTFGRTGVSVLLTIPSDRGPTSARRAAQ